MKTTRSSEASTIVDWIVELLLGQMTPTGKKGGRLLRRVFSKLVLGVAKLKGERLRVKQALSPLS